MLKFEPLKFFELLADFELKKADFSKGALLIKITTVEAMSRRKFERF